MRKLELLLLVGTAFIASTHFASAQDSGLPDTLYLEVYAPDTLTAAFVRVPMYVTHDIVDPAIDSVAGFMIPLCYHHTNPSAYCSASSWWNNTHLYPSSHRDRSIFRHLDGISNWMMNLSEQGQGEEWDFRFLDVGLGTEVFWFCTVPTGTADRRFEGGSRVLLATITFRVKGSTTICIDTCFWPPSDHFAFCNSIGQTYKPKIWDDYLGTEEYCFSVMCGMPGDADGSGIVDVADVLYMLNYLFRQGPPPISFRAGDANCDNDLGILDPLYLLNYLYRNGPSPGC